MLDWIRRIKKISQTLSLPSRDSSSRSQTQLNPAKLIPATEVFLSQLIQHHLLVAELLIDDAARATDANAKKQRAIAARYEARAKDLQELLIKLGASYMELQQHIRDRLDVLVERTEGKGWPEDIMRIYVVFTLLEDAYLRLAKGLTPARRLKVEAMLSDNSLADYCQEALAGAIDNLPQLTNDLALFGRAIVADALLEVRDLASFSEVLRDPPKDPVELTREQFKILEPLTSELVANHTLRMDSLGLTA
ncbi:MAG: hypothetical protein F2536_04710 [Actinobacteria bacterium]|uniref:Unannotated protein n=1 Tax=freshwater metagenome TaxID=449393 RepID=A0A6J6CDG1_9ZZZZ|nr:hypothetical protein [Actinomycetota bacterium]